MLERPLCKECNRCLAEKSATKPGQKKQYYGKLCRGCRHEKNLGKRHPYSKDKKYTRPWTVFKKDKCEACNFVPTHACQLDVDHIDGNRKNNDPTNLQTLCANCHRLKTFQSRDSYNLQYRSFT